MQITAKDFRVELLHLWR